MLRNYVSVIISFCFIVLISSCAKEGPTGPIGPAGPGYTGTISGHVMLYDEYGNRVLSNLDSARIELTSNATNATVFYADTFISPDNTGFYTYLNLVTTGQYYFTAVDSGYGTYMGNYFNFVSGNLNVDVKLSAIPNFILSCVAYQDTIAHNDSLVISCAPDPQIRSCVIFVNSTATTDSGESYVLAYIKPIPANATQISAVINGQELYDAGLAYNTKVYYTIFSHAVNDQSAYEDQTTGKIVYTAVNNAVLDSTYVP